MSAFLIVDDELGLAEMSGEILSSRGHDVVTAPNGKLAMSWLESMRPDVILLDVMMPVMSGLEVLQQLKTHKKTQKIPVILMSAAADSIPPDQRQLAAGVLVKPFTYDQLLGAVRTLLPEA